MIKYFIDRKTNKSVIGDVDKYDENIFIDDKKIKTEDYIVIDCDGCGKEEKAVFKRRDKYFNDKILCTKCHRKETNINKYGSEWPTQSKQVKEKTKQTCIEKYGAIRPNIFGSEEFNKNIKNKYGVDNVNKLKEVRDKIKQTCIEKYGGEGRASEIIREKIENTKLKRYGNKNYTNRNKNNKTIKDKYGVNNISELKQVRKKARQTTIERYGIDNVNGCQWFEIDGKKVQGKFELKIAKLLYEHNINFLTHNDIKPINYTTDKERKYYPDFYLPDYDLYLEPHTEYYWNEEFENKMKKIEEKINILYFNETYNIEEVVLSRFCQL
jgi:hypothetical protein